jgi:hypothetical protein
MDTIITLDQPTFEERPYVILYQAEQGLCSCTLRNFNGEVEMLLLEKDEWWTADFEDFECPVVGYAYLEEGE